MLNLSPGTFNQLMPALPGDRHRPQGWGLRVQHPHLSCPSRRTPGPAPPSHPCQDSCQPRSGSSVRLEGSFAQFLPADVGSGASPSGFGEVVSLW